MSALYVVAYKTTSQVFLLRPLRTQAPQIACNTSRAECFRESSLADVLVIDYIEYVQSHKERIMTRTTTMTVRLNGTLSDFVAAKVGEHGAYENISEYVRDLIRRDKNQTEQQAFDRLKAELTHAFAAPESSYESMNAAEVIARNQA
jgi:putative addiction module CopG family antidote